MILRRVLRGYSSARTTANKHRYRQHEQRKCLATAYPLTVRREVAARDFGRPIQADGHKREASLAASDIFRNHRVSDVVFLNHQIIAARRKTAFSIAKKSLKKSFGHFAF